MTPSRNRRIAVLVTIALLLVGAGVVGSRRGRPTRAATLAASRPTIDTPADHIPIMAPKGSLDSVWYCAAGTASTNGPADNRVVAANVSDQPATATVTVYPSSGAIKTTQIQIAPHGRNAVRLGDLVTADFAAAVVEASGGQVAVEHEVSGPLGIDIAACLTTTSETWYLPTGTTVYGTDEVLAILNPFPADATVNITFATDNSDLDARLKAPPALQALPVPGQSLVIARVSDAVSRQVQVSATVQSTSGRVVVEQLLVSGGTLKPGAAQPSTDSTTSSQLPAPGMVLTPGVPAPARAWLFPDGRKQAGGHERYVVFNPSTRPADVAIDVMLNQPAINGKVSPFVIQGLNPGAYQVVDLDKEARIPVGVEHSATVRSTNGVPIVAERFLQATPPWGRTGAAATTGSPVTATNWVMVEGGSPPLTDQYIVVMNPGQQAAHVRLRIFFRGAEIDPGAGSRVTVPAQDRLVISVRTLKNLPDGGFASQVESDQPVVVERALFELQSLGMASTLAIPAPLGARMATP